jgi:hypothetical protein
MIIIEAAQYSNGTFFMLIVKDIPISKVREVVLSNIGLFHTNAVSFSEFEGENRNDKGVKILIPESATSGTGFGRTVAELTKLEKNTS